MTLRTIRPVDLVVPPSRAPRLPKLCTLATLAALLWLGAALFYNATRPTYGPAVSVLPGEADGLGIW